METHSLTLRQTTKEEGVSLPTAYDKGLILIWPGHSRLLLHSEPGSQSRQHCSGVEFKESETVLNSLFPWHLGVGGGL